MAKLGNLNWRNLPDTPEFEEFKKQEELEEKKRHKWNKYSFKEKIKELDVKFKSDLKLTFIASHIFKDMCNSSGFRGLNLRIRKYQKGEDDRIYEIINKISNKEMSYNSNSQNDEKVYNFQTLCLEIEDIRKDPLELDSKLKEYCESFHRNISNLYYTIDSYHNNDNERYVKYHQLFFGNYLELLKKDFKKIKKHLNI